MGGRKGPEDADVLRVLAEKLDVFQTLREFPDLSAAQLSRLLLRAARQAEGGAEAKQPQPEPKPKPKPKAGPPLPPELNKAADDDWRLFADGASRGNPGPAGAGFALFDPSGEPVADKAVPLGRATNNEAEYQALLLGLEEALRCGVKRLHVFMDSELVVLQMKGRYRVRNPRLAVLHEKVRELWNRFDKCSISHVERAFNAVADELAGQAAKAVKA